MLLNIRDNSQGVVVKVLIGLIVAVMALFGVEQIVSGFIRNPSVAEVNGEEISEAQLQASTQELAISLGGNLQGLDQELIEQIALNQLIEEIMLRQLAAESEMRVSSDRIDRNIVETEQFQIGGAFDSDLAIRTMSSLGFTVPGYRQQLEERMILAQLATAYSSSNFVTDNELQQLAQLTEQTRDFRYLSVPLGTRTLGTPVPDADIQSYYNENPDQFTEQETVVVDYVVLDKDVIADELTVEQTAVQEQYEVERQAFEGSAEKRASHIMFELGTLSEVEALELANAALGRIEAGEDFGALAGELSSDTASAEQGGDIGYSDGSAFPEQIEAALELLTVNEVSQPVVTDFGVHLVKLTEDNQNVYQPFEEVRDRIERELKSAEIELLYAERLEDLSNLAFESGNLQAISDQLGLEIQQSEAFGRVGAPGLFGNLDVSGAAFSDQVLLDGNNSDAIEPNDSQAVVLRINQFNEAAVRPLDEVQAEIAVILRTEMEREAVQNLGSELAAAAESGQGMEPLLTANELQWIEQEGTARDAFTVNREILNEAFSMPTPASGSELASLTLSNGTFVLIELNQVNEGTLDSIPETERGALTSSIMADLGNSDLEAYVTTLRENADISQAPRPTF